ncbi:MAG: hypothetical protein A3K19_19140 [Lentisphaerae bacterium RIFOXYB12_FULL_65_16]|nr:MAG: hypothetical protein A3K19_19140 [Lentisphaerae bacterium RIFOXYB12_FULL_65_16]
MAVGLHRALINKFGGTIREERGGACVWRVNPIHPWHKATGVSHMGQHAVVPPATHYAGGERAVALAGRLQYVPI